MSSDDDTRSIVPSTMSYDDTASDDTKTLVPWTMSTLPTSLSLSSLPLDMTRACLARLPITQFKTVSLTSKTFAKELSSDTLFQLRARDKLEEEIVYCCLSEGNECIWFTLGVKPKENGYWLMKVSPKLLPSSFPVSSKASASLKSNIYFRSTNQDSSLKVINCQNHTSSSDTAPMNIIVNSSITQLVGIDESLYLLQAEEPLSLQRYTPRDNRWETIFAMNGNVLGNTNSLVLAGNSSFDNETLAMYFSSKEAGSNEEVPTFKLSLNLKDKIVLTPNSGLQSSNGTTLLIGYSKIRIVQSKIQYWRETEREWFQVQGSFTSFETPPECVVARKSSLIAVWKKGEHEIWGSEVSVSRGLGMVFCGEVWSCLIADGLEEGFQIRCLVNVFH